MKKAIGAIFAIVAAVSIAACSGDDGPTAGPPEILPSTSFHGIRVSSFMYQIQGLDDHQSIDLLAGTEYDMLVVEPGFNFNDGLYDVNYLVSELKEKPGGERRILLAYIDIGQAEEYRTYWLDSWVAPTETESGFPDFLVTVDPDGWSGNYPVAYWDKAWQNIWTGTGGLIRRIAGYGFDGVYLDWVEAYDDEKVRERASLHGVDTENEMISFIRDIGGEGRSVNPDFLVIAQNAPYLLDADPVLYSSVIDGIATEDTWFYGEGDASWEESGAGDLTGGSRHSEDYTTTARIAQNKKYLQRGIPVFTVDYCILSENAAFVYSESRKYGFIPLVTRISLSRITETPPW